MNMKAVFVPSDAVVIKNNINEKLFWIDSKGAMEIRYGEFNVIGVDLI